MYNVSECDPEVTSTVQMDGIAYESDNFVAILVKDDGVLQLFHKTDIPTMGLMVKQLTTRFAQLVNENYSKEEIKGLADFLGDNFMEVK